MYKLFKLNDDKYLLLTMLSKEFAREFEGTARNIQKRMLALGIDEEEVALGFEALEENDVAEYGIYKTFIFAKRLDPK